MYQALGASIDIDYKGFCTCLSSVSVYENPRARKHS